MESKWQQEEKRSGSFNYSRVEDKQAYGNCQWGPSLAPQLLTSIFSISQFSRVITLQWAALDDSTGASLICP